MRTIETTAVVNPDHTMTVQLPADVPAGPCRVVVVVVEPIVTPSGDQHHPSQGLTAEWPVHDVGPWPEGFTVSREQIYDDDGR